jgi:hypothetical protein
MLAWRARERVRDIHDGDKGASFQLIEAWATQIIENDTTGTYIALETLSKGRFKALFVMLRSIRSRLKTLRPFYTLDSTYT